jgi:hypothetical protein
VFQRHRTVIHAAEILEIEGPIQNVDGVIHVRARRFASLRVTNVTPATAEVSAPRGALPPSHDFR